MKKMKYLEGFLLFCLMVIAAIVPDKKVSADNVTGFYQWDYTANQAQIKIKKYTGGESIVRVPSKINGKPVTTIGREAFANNQFIEEVILPNSVITLDREAFANSGLKKITLPDSVTEVGGSLFENCSKLVSADTGNGLTTLNYNMFYNCSSLQNVRIGNSVVSTSTQIFYGCSSLKSLVVPKQVKNIGSDFIRFCNNLESITLQEGLETLDFEALRESGLKSITIPNSVTSLGVAALESCTDLTYVKLGTGITKIESNVFLACTSLPNVTIPSNVRSIGKYAFERCNSLKTVTFQQGLESIDEGAFGHCPLTSVVLPNTVDTLKGQPFMCDTLQYIVIPKSVIYYDDGFVQRPLGLPTGCEVRGYRGTIAEALTSKYNYKFVPLNEIPATSLTIQESTVQMKIGDTAQLHYSHLPSNTTDAVKWSSSNKDIAEVTALGKVIAKKAGSVTVQAKSTNTKLVKNVTIVVQAAPKKISFKNSTVTVTKGKTYTQKALLDDGARTDYTISYKSSNPSIAAVNSNGTVTGVNVGTATITASISTGISASYKVNVKAPVQKISFKVKKLTIGVKEKVSLKISPSVKVTYKSSKPSAVTVSKTGKIMGKKAGKAVITARSSQGQTAKCTVAVKKAPKKVKLNKSKLALKMGKSYTLKPVFPKGTYSYSKKYTSSNKKVVSVSSTGKVTARKKGKATITMKTFNGKKASCKITVK